jgi:hypothetical protein
MKNKERHERGSQGKPGVHSRSACDASLSPFDDFHKPVSSSWGETEPWQFFKQLLDRAISVNVAVYAGGCKQRKRGQANYA